MTALSTATVEPIPRFGSLPVRTVTLRPAPDREPPFDDERDVALPVGRLDRPLPFPAPPRRAVPPAAPAVVRAGMPEPALWARRLLLGLIEGAAGRRPLAQVAALLSASVAQGVRYDLVPPPGGRRHWLSYATVRSVRCCSPSDRVAEIAATLDTGRRARAVALRLEVRHGAWQCTRLVVG